MTTGLDLVRRQLEIAAGLPLPFTQADVSRRGHAIECRIYAEDPAGNFMPAPGKILFVRAPEGPGIRYDHGVYAGFEVPVQYDPILGKARRMGRGSALGCARMIRALKECVILGVKTPIEFLLDVVSSEPFGSGDTHTGFIEEHFAQWQPSRDLDDLAVLGYVAHEMTGPGFASGEKVRLMGDEWLSPWQRLGAWDLGR